MAILAAIGLLTVASCGYKAAVAIRMKFAGETKEQAEEWIQNFIAGRKEIDFFPLTSDPIFETKMQEIVNDYSIFSPKETRECSNLHCGLPYYAVQMVLRNPDEKEKIIILTKKAVVDSLVRNGFQAPEDVLVNDVMVDGFPGIEIRYSVNKKQDAIIKRVLDLDKKDKETSTKPPKDDLDDEAKNV